jgi:hypothetical protein
VLSDSPSPGMSRILRELTSVFAADVVGKQADMANAQIVSIGMPIASSNRALRAEKPPLRLP